MDDIKYRRVWFESRFKKFVKRPYQDTWKHRYLFTCPCCGFPTLTARGYYQICPICFWEDEGQDDHDADEVAGLNSDYSLTEARKNFKKYLTMYSPSDESHFSRETSEKKLKAKKKLLEFYDEIRANPENIDRKETIDKFKTLLKPL